MAARRGRAGAGQVRVDEAGTCYVALFAPLWLVRPVRVVSSESSESSASSESSESL